MTTIQNVTVIGSGVMGSGIAAWIASAGTKVHLLDIVPQGASDRNQFAKAAIEKIKKSDPAMMTHKRHLKNLLPGNLEDDIDVIKESDWIIEVVLEKLDVKQALYRKLEEHRKEGSIVSSNTSTLPLKNLVEGMTERFKADFLISHFFNPPRYMRLLELVKSAHTKPEHAVTIRDFCDMRLGKGVVECYDTPGFIANRIGCYWLTVALNHALHLGVPVEVADSVMGRPLGIPKTGVFGLMDLIGIDLLPLIAKSFEATLPAEDAFRRDYVEQPVIMQMIADGYTGRKGKGGFYRINKEGGGKVKEAKNLITGGYHPAKEVKLDSTEVSKNNGLRALFEHPDIGGKYAKAVMLDLLAYTASLAEEIAEDIYAIDEAMRLGYNWKFGPFELIDKLSTKEESGAVYLARLLKEAGRPVPEILTRTGAKTLYETSGGQLHYRRKNGELKPYNVPQGAWTLADVKRALKPVAKNPSAALWDIADGILCLELTSKMNAIDPLIFDMIDKAVELCEGTAETPAKYKGLIIGSDAENFSVGANLGLALFAANVASWKMLSEFIARGQKTYQKLKYGKFPVVAAPSGMALGGGCELLLHSDAVNAHIELYAGLVEVGVGVVPGWGGCKEMLYRHVKQRAESDALAAKFGGWFKFISPVATLNTMRAIEPVFTNIAYAKVAKSAEEAKDMLILNEKSRITFNRARMLADAKSLCLELAENYQPPVSQPLRLPGKTARVALDIAIGQAVKAGKATPHDVTVLKALGNVLSGGGTDITKDITEEQILQLELAQFDHLLHTKETLARIEHMLDTGKPLRN